MLCCVSCLWFMSSFRHCAESGISGVPGPGIGDRKLRQFSPPDGVTESTVVFRVTFFGLEMGIGFGTGIEAENGPHWCYLVPPYDARISTLLSFRQHSKGKLPTARL